MASFFSIHENPSDELRDIVDNQCPHWFHKDVELWMHEQARAKKISREIYREFLN
jgi:hypothetical protein